MWVAFAGFVAAMLLVDLLVFGRRGEPISLRRAVGWSIGWTLLGLGFAVFLWLWQGREPAGEYLAGFLIEKSLSIDNLFVFALVFAYFGVPRAFQRRALYWGIVGAILLRGIFILAGAALLDAFHYTIYLFGAFLVVTGVRFARHQTVAIHPERNPLLGLMRRTVPMSDVFREDQFLVREHGRLVATPLLAALALIAAFDVVFAVDSIPAIFAVTRDTFVVYAANAFSLLGLAALYFVLADMIERFRFLNLGLAAVLVFVGLKMMLADVFEIPVLLSLVFIVAALAVAVAVSLARPAPPTLQRSDAADARRDPQTGRRQAARKPAPTEGRP
jgi:tellurite resistance protein TerC